MDAVPRVSAIAALIAEPARARMLNALMNGERMTATELAMLARVTAPTASSHLASLREAALVMREKRGRNHYYSLAGPAVAEAMWRQLGCGETPRRFEEIGQWMRLTAGQPIGPHPVLFPRMERSA